LIFQFVIIGKRSKDIEDIKYPEIIERQPGEHFKPAVYIAFLDQICGYVEAKIGKVFFVYKIILIIFRPAKV